MGLYSLVTEVWGKFTGRKPPENEYYRRELAALRDRRPAARLGNPGETVHGGADTAADPATDALASWADAAPEPLDIGPRMR